MNLVFKFVFALSLLFGSLEAVWVGPQIVSGTTSTRPDVGIDDAGTATAVWLQRSGGNTNVQSAELLKGSTVWSAPLTISTFTALPSIPPQIAVNGSGDAVVVWQEPVGVNFEVRGAFKPAGGSWSAPQTISTESATIKSLDVAMNDAGYIAAVWDETVIKAATVQFGGVWSAPVVISNALDVGVFASVGIDGSGNAVATWFNGTTGLPQSASLPFGGLWSAPVNLSSVSADIPFLDMNASGYAVVVFERFNGVNFLVESTALQFGGSWSTPQQISTPGLDAYQPNVAISDSGIIYAIWTIDTGVTGGVQSAHRTTGGSWSAVEPIITFVATYPDSLHVAVDELGDAYGTWRVDSSIQGTVRQVSAGTWTTPQVLSIAVATAPQIVVDPFGYAVVVWTNITGGAINAAEWIPIPVVTNVNPNLGPPGGGTSVTITGANFIDVTSVMFGSTNALSFVVNSMTSITAISPPGTGVVDVRVTNVEGISDINTNDRFTYISPILPPSNFVGRVVKNIFLNRAELGLFATWQASPSPGVVVYRIYQHGRVVATVAATAPLIFQRLLTSADEAMTFSVAAVNALNQESKRVGITIVN